MARAVKEWVGKTDDTPVPDRVRLRVFEYCKRRCHMCLRIIRGGEKWTLEHFIALINGGENRESNLCLTCRNCLSIKNAADVAIKSKTYDMARKALLPRKPKGRPMDGSRMSKWKRKMNGQVVERRA